KHAKRCYAKTPGHKVTHGNENRRSQNTRSGDLDSLEGHLQLFGVRGKLEGRGSVDVASFAQGPQAFREVLHSFLTAHADRVGNPAVVCFADEFANDRVHDHDLVGRYARLLESLDKLLGDDGFEVV